MVIKPNRYIKIVSKNIIRDTDNRKELKKFIVIQATKSQGWEDRGYLKNGCMEKLLISPGEIF